MDHDRAMTFKVDLASLINRYSLENGSNTPDFLLADYLMDCLLAFNRAMTSRSEWYGAPSAMPSNAVQDPVGPILECTPFDPSQAIVVSWDYREQPNWANIQAALRLYNTPEITIVEHTGDDQCAVIIGERQLSQEEATARYFIE